MERGREACCSPMVKEEPTTTTTTTVASNPSSSSSASVSSASPPSSSRQYRGVRMRKWGKWVAEIREPNKRSRIWLGSYSSPVAAARAYDTAVFYLRGRSARLNFPEEIVEAELMPEPGTSASAASAEGEGLSAALIRKKATEVGARVDAMHAAARRETVTVTDHQSELPQLQQLEERDRNRMRVRNHRNPDLNQAPSPDSSDME
ncbi:Ethylene-responsive transcription factor ERF008 [Rhynchospora pubera]|uniref:Ethylene-responsive transcription factor ERF008 n=1 Tax=Rhynchospora pubera TaxID=906938 RepID=A0AAV8HD04_9POAL|nr:Ethylene-responsive transcription factor ERF008 [Rhynchospora pubera]KAJ4813807.1 Ethylene-responsive transcription factor ERF008 [Rhynchospora pubera]